MQPVWAAACCGGGFSTPALIMGDDKAQLTSSYSYGEIAVDNVDGGGIWRRWDQHDTIQTLRIDGAHLISDRWQLGFSLPMIERESLAKNYSGLGDTAALLGYEYLPDWDYNPFRPKGVGYISVVLPTGKSRFDSDVGGADSRGNGLWAVSVGTMLSKIIADWDAFVSLEAHRSFPKEIDNFSIHGQLVPGYGGNIGGGLGYNWRRWRFGGAITWSYEDPMPVRGITNLTGVLERYATATLALGFSVSDAWSGSLVYADQTWFGSPLNTSLARTGSLQISRRWGR